MADAADARRIVDRHLCDPVGYLRAIRVLHDDYGIREFVEVGARSVLTDSTRDSLPDTLTLLCPPPMARDAAQILEVLAGATATSTLVRAAEPARAVAPTPRPPDTASPVTSEQQVSAAPTAAATGG